MIWWQVRWFAPPANFRQPLRSEKQIPRGKLVSQGAGRFLNRRAIEVNRPYLRQAHHDESVLMADSMPNLHVGQHKRFRLSLPDAKHTFSELVRGCDRSRANRIPHRQPRRQHSGRDNHADTR
jgi:hypothetical protein